jgi:glycerophosphoryl diester phosphodiesterase
MQIIAHRGASYDAPENTIAAARLAWAQHADALEVDVHLTADGRLAVIHDSDTRRTAQVAHVIAQTRLADLQRLDVGAWKEPRFSGETIPALEEVFAVVPEGKRIFVEIKGGAEVVAELRRSVRWALGEEEARGEANLLHGHLQPKQIAIISFDLAAARAAKAALPAHEVCWIADSGREAPLPTLTAIAAAARDAGLDGVDVEANWLTDGGIVKQLRANAFKVYAWTVDDAATARRLAAAGLDGITTNRPGWLRTQLATC